MRLGLLPTGTLRLQGDGMHLDIECGHPRYGELAKAYLQGGGSLALPVQLSAARDLTAPEVPWADSVDPAWPAWTPEPSNTLKLSAAEPESEGEALAKAVAARWNERESRGDEIPADELEADAATLAPFGWCLEFCGMDGWQARQCDPGRGDLMPGTACAAGKVLRLSAWVDPEDAAPIELSGLFDDQHPHLRSDWEDVRGLLKGKNQTTTPLALSQANVSQLTRREQVLNDLRAEMNRLFPLSAYGKLANARR
jgi:hypothetical protein